MQNHDTDYFSSMLGSRICHDLISPLGAIANGVELMQMSGENLGPEVDLITQSVQHANARIRFFRIAFGQSLTDQRIALQELRSVLTDITATGKQSYELTGDGDTHRMDAKLLFLTLLCLETGLPWGGKTAITHTKDGWDITATSDRLQINPTLWANLNRTDEYENIKPATLQFALLPSLLKDTGRRISMRPTDNEIHITLT
ncbi:MAG: histidine phosphotransferase family protein [Halocynthiibacter sp.]